MTLSGKPLIARHLKALATRFITAELAHQAQLRTVSSTEGAEQIGRPNNADYSGILIPYFWPGESYCPATRLRRDKPDIEMRGTKKREVRKYLAAPGAGNRLYFPPTVQPEQLADAAVPLIVTEGEFKALALARMCQELEMQIVPAALSGVANWRGRIGKTTDENGFRIDEKGPIVDWDRITLENRIVYIVYDADVVSNPTVRVERHKLAEFLTERRAKPRYVTLDPKGPKGVDDALAAHGAETVWREYFEAAKPSDALAECVAIIEQSKSNSKPLFDSIALFAPLNFNQLAQVKEQIRRQLKNISLRDFEHALRAERGRIAESTRSEQERKREALRYRGFEYESTPDGIVYWKPLRDAGHQATFLCNFTAEIVADVRRDDGEQQTRALMIRAGIRHEMRDVIVDAADFAAMSWPINELGARANVYPNLKEHTRSAIQELSTNVEERYLYEHTGWTQINGQHVYLHAAGGIGAEGAVPVSVELDKLDRFELPDPPARAELRRAIRSSLEMLDCQADAITMPVYSAIWRAPLGECPTSVFLAGHTGYGKSQLAALAQQHFGATMSAEHLPANWTWTANALEALTFRAKNALVVVDDFIPAGGQHDVSRLQREADRLIRAQGNAGGRGRLSADAELKATKWPRGIILSTGEDVPRGHSLRARMVIVELPAQLDWRQTTRAQRSAAAGDFSAAMSGYVRYLAPLMPAIPQRIAQALEKVREAMSGNAVHARTPDNIAQLAAGFRLFLEYALHTKAIDEEEAQNLEDRAWRAFDTIAEAQSKEQQSEEPAGQFVEYIAAAVRGGLAYISGPGGRSEKPCSSAERWGWDAEIARGDWIGWIDGDDVYLETQLAYAVCQEMSRRLASPFLTTLATLGKRLKQRGMLASVDQARETNYVRRAFLGVKINVFHLSTATLAGKISFASRTDPAENPTFPTFLTPEAIPGSESGSVSGFGVGKNGQNSKPDTDSDHKESTAYPVQMSGMSGMSGFSDTQHIAGDKKHPRRRISENGPKNPTPKPDTDRETEDVAL